ncbi:MAG: iron complex outermembrane receptor protein [Arenicella sp.]
MKTSVINTSVGFGFLLLSSSAYPGDVIVIETVLVKTVLVKTVLVKTVLVETVLMIGTMRDQNGSTVPLSWSEIDANAIALTRHTHINELMQQVSGAWISRGSGQEHLTALLSPVLTDAGGCGSFYMAVDGIELRAPGLCNVIRLFDANSEQASEIEVIKGPGTALYGSNAMHGVINILSVPPSKNRQQVLGVDVGGFGYTRARYRFQNGWDNQGLSLLTNITSDKGFVDNTGFDQQKMSARYDNALGEWKTKTLIEYSNLNQETGGYVLGYKVYDDDARKRENPNPEAFRNASSFRGYSAISKHIDTNNELVFTPYLRSHGNR